MPPDSGGKGSDQSECRNRRSSNFQKITRCSIRNNPIRIFFFFLQREYGVPKVTVRY